MLKHALFLIVWLCFACAEFPSLTLATSSPIDAGVMDMGLADTGVTPDPNGRCITNADCIGSRWGQFCIFSPIEGSGLCQPCLQDTNGPVTDTGCSAEQPACGWGADTGANGQLRSVYFCTGCWADSCSPGLRCNTLEDRCE